MPTLSLVQWYPYQNLVKNIFDFSDAKTTSCHDDTKLNEERTGEIIAEKYGVSARTLQRKICLTYLIDSLADLLESGKLKQAAAIDISYFALFSYRYFNCSPISRPLYITVTICTIFSSK